VQRFEKEGGMARTKLFQVSQSQFIEKSALELQIFIKRTLTDVWGQTVL